MCSSTTSFATTVFLATALAGSCLWGQADSDLLEQVRTARESFRPLERDHVARRRQVLQRAMSQLDQTLARSRPGYAQGWKAYLRWDELNQSLASDETADPAALRVVLERFRRNNAGLELPKFLQVRDRLSDYIEALESTREAKLQDNYTSAIDDLAKRVEEYEASPTGLNGPEIGRTLGWLQSSGQAEQLVAAVQERFDHPNVYARASERFLGAGFNAYVDRTTPITDVILGTSIRGTGRFMATQVLDTVPSHNDARMNILLRGNVHSRNTGYNGPVTIQNTAVTSVYATKQLVVNENGVFAVPSRAVCRTDTKIHSISAKCGLIERIAWKRAGQQEVQAEAIASSHAAARINGYVDREALGPVARANREFQEKFRWPLLRRGHVPREMVVSSNNYGIGMRMLQMTRDQIAAPSGPPEVSNDHDLAIQAHESFVANFSAAAIGGIELTDERLAEMLQETTGNVPEELQITEDKEPWSITFAEHYPVATQFDGDQVKVYLRANRFTRGRNEDGTVDTEVKGLVEISANYTIEKTDVGATLHRQGEVNVDFVGQEKLSAAQVATKTFLRRKFSSLFKPEFVGEGLKLKGRWERAGRLALREIKADKGWISVGWQQ